MTRRTALRLCAATAVVGLTGRAAAQQKLAQNIVQYQDKPKDGHQCSQCLQFVAPDSCKVVDGKISPQGWCVAFVAKPA